MKKINMGWFTGVGLVAMLLAIGNLIYTCTRNNGEKYVQQYIAESEYVHCIFQKEQRMSAMDLRA